MDRKLPSSNERCFDLKRKIATFCLGIFIGSLGNLMWQELLAPANFVGDHVITREDLEILRSETDDKLLKYIEGKWRSPIGDLIVNINDSDIDGSFVVIENISIKPKRQEKYKVVNIEKVDGIFGIVKLSICSELTFPCDEQKSIKIQLNKIFGIKDTISISYDKRFSHCIEKTQCTRAFKQIVEE